MGFGVRVGGLGRETRKTENPIAARNPKPDKRKGFGCKGFGGVRLEAPCVGLDRDADVNDAVPHVEEQLRENLVVVMICKVVRFRIRNIIRFRFLI